jgi:hypothetical protein
MLAVGQLRAAEVVAADRMAVVADLTAIVKLNALQKGSPRLAEAGLSICFSPQPFEMPMHNSDLVRVLNE